jgi:hypothetical protein
MRAIITWLPPGRWWRQAVTVSWLEWITRRWSVGGLLHPTRRFVLRVLKVWVPSIVSSLRRSLPVWVGLWWRRLRLFIGLCPLFRFSNSIAGCWGRSIHVGTCKWQEEEERQHENGRPTIKVPSFPTPTFQNHHLERQLFIQRAVQKRKREGSNFFIYNKQPTHKTKWHDTKKRRERGRQKERKREIRQW